jgi:hypothetical protein
MKHILDSQRRIRQCKHSFFDEVKIDHIEEKIRTIINSASFRSNAVKNEGF